MAFGLKFLDGEKLFTVYWAEMGTARSYGKMVNWCKSNNIINPKTQKPPNRMGIWKAVWRWAVNHQEKAFEIAQKGFMDGGEFLTRERWEKELNEKVNTSYQSDSFSRRWKQENTEKRY